MEGYSGRWTTLSYDNYGRNVNLRRLQYTTKTRHVNVILKFVFWRSFIRKTATTLATLSVF